MEILTSILLGILQGATEFLPISSSGHLVLAEALFHIEEAGLTFDVALHMGTLLAVIIYFRSDLLAIASAFIKLKDSSPELKVLRLTGLYICAATLPAVFAGLLLEDYAETTFRTPALVACTLAGAGALLLWSEKQGMHNRQFESLTLKDAIIIGFCQAFAIIPGVSRSGITMTAGLFMNLDRPAVARFSFLLSVPIILGAGSLNILKMIRQGFEQGQVLFFLTGFIAAAVSGYFFISFLMRYIQTKSFAVFVYYRFILAGIVVWVLVL